MFAEEKIQGGVQARCAGAQLAELMLAIETGLALEQLASPDALGGPGLPVLGRLNSWLAPAPVPSREET